MAHYSSLVDAPTIARIKQLLSTPLQSPLPRQGLLAKSFRVALTIIALALVGHWAAETKLARDACGAAVSSINNVPGIQVIAVKLPISATRWWVKARVYSFSFETRFFNLQPSRCSMRITYTNETAHALYSVKPAVYLAAYEGMVTKGKMRAFTFVDADVYLREQPTPGVVVTGYKPGYWQVTINPCHATLPVSANSREFLRQWDMLTENRTIRDDNTIHNIEKKLFAGFVSGPPHQVDHYGGPDGMKRTGVLWSIAHDIITAAVETLMYIALVMTLVGLREAFISNTYERNQKIKRYLYAYSVLLITVVAVIVFSLRKDDLDQQPYLIKYGTKTFHSVPYHQLRMQYFQNASDSAGVTRSAGYYRVIERNSESHLRWESRYYSIIFASSVARRIVVNNMALIVAVLCVTALIICKQAVWDGTPFLADQIDLIKLPSISDDDN